MFNLVDTEQYLLLTLRLANKPDSLRQLLRRFSRSRYTRDKTEAKFILVGGER
jgi:hypothetical protein